MGEEQLREFFAYVQMILNVKLGKFCDRNDIYRSDFTNFMKHKKYFTPLWKLDRMRSDIMDHVIGFVEIYEKIV